MGMNVKSNIYEYNARRSLKQQKLVRLQAPTKRLIRRAVILGRNTIEFLVFVSRVESIQPYGRDITRFLNNHASSVLGM